MNTSLLPMKNWIILFVIFAYSTVLSGQISFESGYLIDNDNKKTECLIKNTDWEINPAAFEYKLSESGGVNTGDTTSVKEFGILGQSRYVRGNVKIDRSPTEIAMLTSERNPVWHRERLFLKVLVQGRVTLYHYGETNFNKFFYSVTDSVIQQLIFKEYKVGSARIAENPTFRQQLLNDVSCGQPKISTIERIQYNKRELEKYFRQYNACVGDSSVVYGHKNKRETFKLNIVPGINVASLSVFNGTFEENLDFTRGFLFRLGLEAEYILPFNKNKWGVIFEPSYQLFNAQKQEGTGTASIDYRALDFSIGLRHYFFLNGQTSVFINGFINSLASADFGSKIHLPPSTRVLEIKSIPNLAIGAGGSYKRIRVEIRYYTNQEILTGYARWGSSYQKTAVLLGYSLFKNRSHK